VADYTITNREEWNALDATIRSKMPTKPFVVSIKPEKRTTDQNSLIHALFEDCAKLTKIKNAIWWKNELKGKLGITDVHKDLEDRYSVIVLSTTEYSKEEISDFIVKVEVYMLENYEVLIKPREINDK